MQGCQFPQIYLYVYDHMNYESNPIMLSPSSSQNQIADYIRGYIITSPDYDNDVNGDEEEEP